MSEILQLKIVLDHIKPAIWRRVLVRDDLTFQQLHKVIQAAMGWEDYHMYEFELSAPRLRIGVPTKDAFGDFFGTMDRLLDAKKTRLADVLAGKRKFSYWYDFGDDWWHTISIEKRLPSDPAAPPAQLIAGEFACPPEDCGGPYGYIHLLEALADPAHPEHGELKEWIGDVQPTQFDLTSHARQVAAAIKTRKPKAKD